MRLIRFRVQGTGGWCRIQARYIWEILRDCPTGSGMLVGLPEDTVVAHVVLLLVVRTGEFRRRGGCWS